ncbi:MAG: glycosyltransferase family 4 protein [Candidatus Krumholzibacteriota bacterium]|nr:glycosyltransferase family 4 protein [Candidatus Krumholzibacteriota bacterium]
MMSEDRPIKIKIAILGTKGVPGHHGVEVVVDSLLPHLSSLGDKITVFGYSSYCNPRPDYNGAVVKTVRGSDRKNLEMISHMWKASLHTRREEYDLVHIHSTDPCLLAWVPRSRYGVVATSHGQAYVRKKWGALAKGLSRMAERFFIRLPAVTTCVSKPLTDYYHDRYGARVIYIPNGIAIREKPPVAWLEKWSLEPSSFLFCSAGRIERTKGLSTLLRAYRKLETTLPLVIAGGGAATDQAYFEELKSQKPEGVIFTGFLTGDEYFSLYAHAGIFVFPSEYEAMSMALLEGLSFGTPTVYSDIPENEEVARGIGYPFRVADSDSLAAVLRSVLENREQALSRGREAMIRVREKHSWETIAGQYQEIYRNLIDRKTSKQERTDV